MISTRRWKLLLWCSLLAYTLYRLHENKWAVARSLGVKVHFTVWSWILGTLGFAATSQDNAHARAGDGISAYMTDFSEGALWRTSQLRHVLAGLGAGGCVWDVGANNGIFYSNSYHLIASRRMHAWLYEADATAFTHLQQLYYYSRPDRRGRHYDAMARATSSSSGRYIAHPWLPPSHISNRVRLFNFGLGDERRIATMRAYPASFENTIVDDKRGQYGASVGEYNVLVEDGYLLCVQQREAIAKGLCDLDSTSTLRHEDLNGHNQTRQTREHRPPEQGGKAALKKPRFTRLTVLSVDVEGSDMKVVQAAHRGYSNSGLPGHGAAAHETRGTDDAKKACRWDVLIVENAPAQRWKQYFKALGYSHAFRNNYNDVYLAVPET